MNPVLDQVTHEVRRNAHEVSDYLVEAHVLPTVWQEMQYHVWQRVRRVRVDVFHVIRSELQEHEV